jgi:hypothetical protein
MRQVVVVVGVQSGLVIPMCVVEESKGLLYTATRVTCLAQVALSPQGKKN